MSDEVPSFADVSAERLTLEFHDGEAHWWKVVQIGRSLRDVYVRSRSGDDAFHFVAQIRCMSPDLRTIHRACLRIVFEKRGASA